LRKKSNAGGITIPDFKLYFTAIVTKRNWYWHKNMKCNGTEDPEINLCSYTHLFNFWQRNPKHTLEKRQPLQQMMLGKVCSTSKRLKLDHYLSPCTKINSKWIKDLNVRPETLKLLWENFRRYRHGQVFSE
jgi:hypothetical protein